MVYEAADAGDWAAFLKLLGSPAPARKDLPIQLAKVESLETGKYGDPIGMQVIGVIAQCVTLKTKSHQWVIMSVKRLVASFESVSRSFGLRESRDGGTDARASAQRTDRSGEAALEFCQ